MHCVLKASNLCHREHLSRDEGDAAVICSQNVDCPPCRLLMSVLGLLLTDS
jgi:hypothetical protein